MDTFLLFTPPSVGFVAETRADRDSGQGTAPWKEPPQDGVPASQSRAAGGPFPASPGRAGKGERAGAKGTEQTARPWKNAANNTSGVEGGIWHSVFYSLTGKINSNRALSKHPLVA